MRKGEDGVVAARGDEVAEEGDAEAPAAAWALPANGPLRGPKQRAGEVSRTITIGGRRGGSWPARAR